MLFTSFKSVSQHSSARRVRRAAAATHQGCVGKRDYGAAHTDKREREEPDQPDIETRRELPRGARAAGSGQHYWCCLPGASDIGAGLVVAVVVEQ